MKTPLVITGGFFLSIFSRGLMDHNTIMIKWIWRIKPIVKTDISRTGSMQVLTLVSK